MRSLVGSATAAAKAMKSKSVTRIDIDKRLTEARHAGVRPEREATKARETVLAPPSPQRGIRNRTGVRGETPD
jgi:hypothetical protein